VHFVRITTCALTVIVSALAAKSMFARGVSHSAANVARRFYARHAARLIYAEIVDFLSVNLA
jgi:hypothetical protein